MRPGSDAQPRALPVVGAESPVPALLIAALGLAASLASTTASAQPADRERAAAAPPPLTIGHAEGRVGVVRANGLEPVHTPDLLEDDDRLVTGDGRAELIDDGGALVHVDRDSDLRIDAGVRLRLTRGRLIVHTLDAEVPIGIALPTGRVVLEPRGEYHLAAADLQGDTEIAVVRGRATLQIGDDVTAVSEGDALRLDPRDRRQRWSRGTFADAFSDWSHRRLAQATVQNDARGLLPPAARPWSADFALYGSWTTVAPYGEVWFPARGPGWRPYADGSWRFTQYGWTWIDAERWAWPLHHYGRWGVHPTRGWYWIPERRWAPAWVGWVVGADHVGWAPLGWNARPVVDFAGGVHHGRAGELGAAWSILSRHDFGRRDRVRGYLQDPQGLPGPVLGGFVSQMIGPRGPADGNDRYAATSGRRDTPPRWPVAVAPARPEDRAVIPERRADDAPRGGVVVRRPMDAPAVDPRSTTSPRGQPDAPAGAADATSRRRDPGEVRPVGAPVRPRVPPGDGGAGGENSAHGAPVAAPRGPRAGSREQGTAGVAGSPGRPDGGATHAAPSAPVRGPGRSRDAGTDGDRRAPSGAGAPSAARPRGPRDRGN